MRLVVKNAKEIILNTVNSLLTDTSLKRTRGVGPCHTSVIYFISLQGGHLSKSELGPSVSALEGVECNYALMLTGYCKQNQLDVRKLLVICVTV